MIDFPHDQETSTTFSPATRNKYLILGCPLIFKVYTVPYSVRFPLVFCISNEVPSITVSRLQIVYAQGIVLVLGSLSLSFFCCLLC